MAVILSSVQTDHFCAAFSLRFSHISAPASFSNRSISVWPYSSANIRAVQPLASFMFTSAPLPSRVLTISVCPFNVAIIRGVLPEYSSRAFTNARLAKSAFTVSVSPKNTALIKAVPVRFLHHRLKIGVKNITTRPITICIVSQLSAERGISSFLLIDSALQLRILLWYQIVPGNAAETAVDRKLGPTHLISTMIRNQGERFFHGL